VGNVVVAFTTSTLPRNLLLVKSKKDVLCFGWMEKRLCGKTFTVGWLAAKADLSEGFVSLVLAGHRWPRAENLARIAHVLKVDIGELTKELLQRRINGKKKR
jgi:hypothetical protein